MTKAELIKELEPYPDNMDIFMDERKTEFSFGLLNSVGRKKIGLAEEPEDEPLAEQEVIILSEE